jgi:hypothetical protein
MEVRRGWESAAVGSWTAGEFLDLACRDSAGWGDGILLGSFLGKGVAMVTAVA